MRNIAAGQVYKAFEVHSRRPVVNRGGRVLYNGGEVVGAIRAAVSEISPREVERYRQTEHPVTHRLIINGSADVKPGDILQRDGAKYYVQWVKDAGMLGICTVIFCEKRAV